ncbi:MULTISPECIES: NlpC/P60 family protein [Corynebacterium]|uniref:NlpC/P60 family protein n=1 Tax=Corynebacterium TaxID=1716 RepID=UPI002109FF52|nr:MULTISPECIES: NlpC/P60 family protein [Corynebacterium]MCQ4607886.1 C40 family peptidase [Corynebacterium pseudogenitalium]MDK8363223.1 NlpC/P60 family protein [Corynebacterium sp. UMB10119B]
MSSPVGPAVAAPAAQSTASALVAKLSASQAEIAELDLKIGQLREAANRAFVDLHDAQSRSEQARRGAEEAKRRLEESQAAVEKARAELSAVTRSQYRNSAGGSPIQALGGEQSQKDVLDRSLFLRQRSEEKQQKLAEVEQARLEAANDESLQRQASEVAQQAADEAAAAESATRDELASLSSQLDDVIEQREAASAELNSIESDVAQERGISNNPAPQSAEVQETPAETYEVSPELLDAVEERMNEIAPGAEVPNEQALVQAVNTAQRTGGYVEVSNQADTPRLEYSEGSDVTDLLTQAATIVASEALVGSSQPDHNETANPYGGSSTSDVIAAFAQGLNSVLAADSSAGQPDSATSDLSQVVPAVGTFESITNEVRSALAPSANSSSVETVIARAEAMIGTPYVWGGGDANGPTVGVNGGSMSGFDCSGLVLYAFAGVGISLPHYTGYQYQRGTPVAPSEAQRGDLLFWGPGGSQHVAIYLGDGMMIEAPQAGQNVQIAPVRWSGMSANAVRLL